MKTYFLFCASVLLLVGICGCSQQSAQLGRQLVGANRVVATNTGTRASLSIAGGEAKTLAAAVVSAKRDRNYYPAMFDWEVQFYSGTNFLAAIHLQDRVFRNRNAQYSEETGVLKAFYDRLLRDATAP